MKKLQYKVVIPWIIIIVLIVGGGTFYYNQNHSKKEILIEENISPDVKIQDNNKEDIKKPQIVSFEVQARTQAEASECSGWGTIGKATKLDEKNQYALFAIDNSKIPTTRNTCVVDFYAGTAEAPFVITPESIPGPRKTESAAIQKARIIANNGECKRGGTVTSFEGYMNGDQFTIFRVSSIKDKSEIGQCFVNIDRNSSEIAYPAL